ncbi:cell division cycle protein 27 homolog isoform X1 [Dendroctonus ponderosae]|uniref:Cell division cycle protein 27 homolog n=1 Tax=Dendroctonus ponderosae TaxID=77166 RepID=A0AAR5PR91_DENPD|nr:cell division cycle protein 27 homolog isoform X1 [Dendroctonus ponderosae]
MIVQEPVQAAIWHCLNHYDYPDAVFLSERLYAEVKSDETLFLLATAYYRSGKTTQSYDALKERYSLSTQCQLLFGLCAFELEKFAEAEAALVELDDGTKRSLDDIVTDFGDEAPFALVLLGKIGAQTERNPRAAEAWKKALKLNPFLYSAFEELCKIGENPNPNAIFQGENIDNVSMCHGHSVNNIESVIITPANQGEIVENSKFTDFTPYKALTITTNLKPKAITFATPDESPLANPLTMSGLAPIIVRPRKSQKMRNDCRRNESPSFGQLFDNSEWRNNGTPAITEVNNSLLIPKKISAQEGSLFISRAKDSIFQNSKPVLSQSSNVPTKTPTGLLNTQPNQNVRRSSRLFSSHSVKENNKSPTRNKFVTPKSPSRKTKQRLTKNISKNFQNLEQGRSETITSDAKTEKNLSNSSGENCIQQAMLLQKHSTDGLMNLLRTIGQAYVALSSYECQTTVQILSSLPLNQFETSWVYCLMGVAYFEMSDYESSIKYFQMVHSQDPHRLECMDIYSTALWHLQKEVALSALAHDLINTNRNHPITWCVSGNCFSLHKEHDTAIKFFQRAVQVDPKFHYAYTLLGHEYITTEELDKAMSCFWNAVRINPRHYNAWFGVGTIYSKQERYSLAEWNYSRALSINPKSSVILCHIGMVQHALKQTDKALATFNRAIANNPKSALCKFHRGSIYFALGRHAEALKELEELKVIVPKESSVYYLIGKVHKKMGNTDLALQYFSWATDLDPKGASSQIKEAFDPAIGLNNDLLESPQTPPTPIYPPGSINLGSEGEMHNHGMIFDGPADDSVDSVFD